MDLAIGAKNVFVMMGLFDKAGSSKLVPECTYPLTGKACVTRLYTEHALFSIVPDGVRVEETYGIDMLELRDRLAIDLLE